MKSLMYKIRNALEMFSKHEQVKRNKKVEQNSYQESCRFQSGNYSCMYVY